MTDIDTELQPDEPEYEWDLTGIPEDTRDLQPSSDWFAAPDIHLRRMSYYADSIGTGIVVNLVVPGGIISGMVVGAAHYFETLSTFFQEEVAAKGDDRKTTLGREFAEFFFDQPAKSAAEQIEKDTQDFRDGKLKEPRYFMARHIHLTKAYFTVPGNPSVELGHTRVLLSRVVSWSIGGHLNGVDNDPWG